MPVWHCMTTRDTLEDGAEIQVESEHSVVRIQTADQMTIETSGGDRLMAVVIEREGGRLIVGLPDGRTVRMIIVADHALEVPEPTKPFSSQSWKVVAGGRGDEPAGRSPAHAG